MSDVDLFREPVVGYAITQCKYRPREDKWSSFVDVIPLHMNIYDPHEPFSVRPMSESTEYKEVEEVVGVLPENNDVVAVFGEFEEGVELLGYEYEGYGDMDYEDISHSWKGDV